MDDARATPTTETTSEGTTGVVSFGVAVVVGGQSVPAGSWWSSSYLSPAVLVGQGSRMA